MKRMQFTEEILAAVSWRITSYKPEEGGELPKIYMEGKVDGRTISLLVSCEYVGLELPKDHEPLVGIPQRDPELNWQGWISVR